MSAALRKPEWACLCGKRAPNGAELCGCGERMYLVGSDPWAKCDPKFPAGAAA